MVMKLRRGFTKEKIIKLVVCLALVLVLIFRNKANCNYAHIASFVLIFILVNHIIPCLIKSFVLSVIIWGLLLIILKNYLNINLENFENDEANRQGMDEQTKERVSHLKDMIKKLEGGIPLKKEDLTVKNNLKDYDFKKSKVSPDEDKLAKKKGYDDMTPREAQKGTYELIDTVKQLKETVGELAPVLKEGKSILSSLGALKI